MATSQTVLSDANLRSRWTLLVPIGVVLLTALLSLRHVKSNIPKDFYLLAGPKGSDFYQNGLEYKAFLEDFGIEVHVVATAGTTQNLEQLVANDRPQAAFAESGTERYLPELAISDLVSLGSLYVEPAWLFVRHDQDIANIKQLRGKRVILGVRGSGARALAQLLVEANGVEELIVAEPYDELSPHESLEALREGRVDAMFLTGPPDAPAVSELLGSQHVRPLSFKRAAAYARRYEMLVEVDLPEGTYDLAEDVPAEDLQLVSLASGIAIREDLHPAIVDLLLLAGKQVHGGQTLFNASGTFPNAQHVSLPLHPAATRFFEQGPARWREQLPFWLATLIDRFLVFGCTVATAAVAAFSVLPKLLSMRFQFAINQNFRRLARIEAAQRNDDNRAELQRQVEAILNRTDRLKVPLSQVALYLEFRQAAHDLRDRLESPRA